MTEIPEHLLKRSVSVAPRQRRRVGRRRPAGSPATPATTAATPSTTPAVPTPAKPAAPPVKAPPVVKPDPPYVAAAKARPKIPWWAMSTLAIMPFFLIMYVRGLTPSEASAEGPVAAGAELFGGCASCHGADGAGGAGRQLSEGDVLITFPKIEWQLNLVYTGSQVHAGQVYGDPNREGGPHIGLEFNGSPMPQQGAALGGALTDAEILAVVCHERFDLPGNADPTSAEWAPEYEKWCSPESEIYAGLEDGSLTFDDPELGVGTEPIDFAVRPTLGQRRQRSDRRRLRVESPSSVRPVPDADHDVLVVGGGPAGAATAYWLARHGHRVAVVERKTFPREKTCGDGLTPRAVYQLDEMGLGTALQSYHRFDGLRATAHGKVLELPWPQHPTYPSHGYVVRRRELDQLVAKNAVDAGAVLLEGHEALDPVVERGFVRGATVRHQGSVSQLRAKYVVVADGANSRFGRALGTVRAREWPYGTAIRTYWSRHATPSRGSRPRSISRTATAIRCPATAGSSRSVTARSTSASACCRRSATSRASTPATS